MNTKTRVLSLVMTLAIILSSLVIVIPASAETAAAPTTDGKPWTDYAATEFAGGTGTKEDPYQIATAEQLALLAKLHEGADYATWNTKAYKLTANIDLKDHEWVSIGGSRGTTDRFMGSFDGGIYDGETLTGKYTISNLTVTTGAVAAVNDYYGLFGYAAGASNGDIKNFNLTGSITGITSSYKQAEGGVALVCGKLGGSKKLINVDASGTVEVTVTASQAMVAGLVAVSHNAEIYDCSMSGTVRAIAGKAGIQCLAGGIVCANSKGVLIKRTVNNANVEALTYGDANTMLGGFMAVANPVSDSDWNEDATKKPVIIIEGCINTAKITYGLVPGQSMKSGYNQRMGGFIGATGRGTFGGSKYPNVTLQDCMNMGIVELASGTQKGTDSGLRPFVGYDEKASESKTDGSAHLLKLDGLYIPVWYDLNPQSHIEPYQYDQKRFNYGAGTSSDYRLAIDATVDGGDAVIRISKDAVETYLACGFTMEITYGDQKITWTEIPEGATVGNDCYEIKVVAEDATPTMTMTKTVAGNTYVHEAEVATWADFYAEMWTGSGTEEDPFLIDTEGKLAYLADYIARCGGSNAKFFEIDGELDLGAHEWLPIGLTHANANYNGGYTGCGTLYATEGSVIKNVKLTAEKYNYSQSFIGYCNWIINDLAFDGVEIDSVNSGTAQINAAALLGSMYASRAVTGVSVKNLNMTGAATGYNGGIVGYMGDSGAQLINCSVEGQINLTTNQAARVGGLAGRARYGTINGGKADLDIKVTYTGATPTDKLKNVVLSVGGIMGVFEPNAVDEGEEEEAATISGSTFDGSVTVVANGPYARIGIGGIAGAGAASGVVGAGALTMSENNNFGTLTFVDNSALVPVEGETEVTPCLGIGGMIGVSTLDSITAEDCYSFTTDELVGYKGETVYDMPAETNVSYNTKATMLDTTAVRLDVTGINFYASVNKALFDALTEDYTVMIGLEIAHADDPDNKQILVYDVSSFADPTADRNGFVLTTETDYVFGGTVTNIIDPDRDFVVKAFITVDIGDSVEHWFVSDAQVTASLADLAAAELADTKAEQDDVYVNYVEEGVWSRYSATQREQLQSFIPVPEA